LSNDPQIAEKIPGKHEKNVKKQDELKARDLPEKQHHILPTSLLKKKLCTNAIFIVPGQQSRSLTRSCSAFALIGCA